MRTLLINGVNISFDKVIEFEQHKSNMLECFFFKKDELVASKFLTLIEFKNIQL